VSPDHGNFLVNHGAATAAQFAELMALVRTRVREAHGVELEPEVEIWAATDMITR
jgi:UDP-N-acetylmuramate dehydrogenase